MNRRITEADQRLGRLFDAIEAGMLNKDDAMAKERMTSLKALRDQAAAVAERTQLARDSSGNQGVTPDMLKGFARKARERIGLDDGGYRRDHLRALRSATKSPTTHHGIEVGTAANAGRRFKRRNGGVRRS